MTLIKTSEEIQYMREGGKILQSAHQIVKENAKAGISLLELDKLAEEKILSLGGAPGFKGYKGFPGTLCTMLNSEVVHGIPDDRKLKDGDLLSVDCGVLWKNLFTDAAFSLVVGGDDKNPARAEFCNCVQRALKAGCEAAKVGNWVSDIGAAIEAEAKKGRHTICRDYTGHGVGHELHEKPTVYNYQEKRGDMRLREGMTLAIEPIVVMGKRKTKTLKDGWTVVTLDGRDACQWEHCGVVGKNGFEIFV